MAGTWHSLIAEDDTSAMERSCFNAFIAPEQRDALLEMWHRYEVPDNAAFIEIFAPSLAGLEEAPPIELDDE